MKIFVFVYIRRWGGLVAQGIRGINRSCFGTQNRNDNRTVTGTVSAVGEFTVPVWAPETGTVLGVTVPV